MDQTFVTLTTMSFIRSIFCYMCGRSKTEDNEYLQQQISERTDGNKPVDIEAIEPIVQETEVKLSTQAPKRSTQGRGRSKKEDPSAATKDSTVIKAVLTAKFKAESTVIKDYDETTNFPFLVDEKTSKFISSSKVMFIMRGLPGSGKSYLVKLLLSVYPNAVVCSADHYFMRDGEYNWSADKLPNAHEACHQNAERECKAETNTVIIDNTNVRKWEMQFYVKVAMATGYIVIVVSPKTDWRFNLDILAQKNSHDVPMDALKRKVKDFQHLIPLYYGWYLTDVDTARLISHGEKLLQECVAKLPGMTRCIPGLRGSREDLSTYFKRYSESKTLHCTAKFCLGGKVKDASAYNNMKHIQDACGKHFPLVISGFVITPETFSARVELNSAQLSMYHKPEENEMFCDSCFSLTQNSFCASEAHYSRMTSLTQGHPVKFRGHGRTAHVTLGCADGIRAKEANNSMLSMSHIEEEIRLCGNSEIIETAKLSRSEAIHYHDGLCAIYLTEPIHFDCLFAGQY